MKANDDVLRGLKATAKLSRSLRDRRTVYRAFP
jgi:hypothetical protein